jgi:hypothetical protein
MCLAALVHTVFFNFDMFYIKPHWESCCQAPDGAAFCCIDCNINTLRLDNMLNAIQYAVLTDDSVN